MNVARENKGVLAPNVGDANERGKWRGSFVVANLDGKNRKKGERAIYVG